MTIPGNLLTTGMAVMPHTDIDRALETALTLDVPFWPQLPNFSYYEDMYVQAVEHFPGIILDMDKKRLGFSMDKFITEFEESTTHFYEPEFFDVSTTYSAVYYQFLKLDLSDKPAIRIQLEGPVSFGFNVLDQYYRPILFDDNIRPFLFKLMAKRINVQLNIHSTQTPVGNPMKLVTFRELAGVGPLFSNFSENTAKTIDQTFSRRLSAREQRCRELFGRVVDDASCDLSVRFKALPQLPVIFQFNDSEDSFPANSTLMFHANAKDYLDIKSLAAIGTYLVGSLIRQGNIIS